MNTPNRSVLNSEQSEHSDMGWHDVEAAMAYELTPGVYEALQAVR